MTTIEVRVSKATLAQWGNSVHAANFVMSELVKRGVPVAGALFPIGIERGRIVIEEDAFGDDIIYTWEDN